MTVHNFQYTIRHRTVLIISLLTEKSDDIIDKFKHYNLSNLAAGEIPIVELLVSEFIHIEAN